MRAKTPRIPAMILLLLVAAPVGGCLVEADAEEAEPEGTAEQGISKVSCTVSNGKGYTKGKKTNIKVVKVDGKSVEIRTANAYHVMAKAASKAGVEIRVVSGFRTMAEQEKLYSCYKKCNCNGCALAAKPGYSNHQSGHALDLNTRAAGVLEWLKANAAKYGFKRTVPSEPWHWEWWGGGPGGGPCKVPTTLASLAPDEDEIDEDETGACEPDDADGCAPEASADM
jgi:hypothetical protein